ncbi:A24 family peptidase [Altererythrobacter sp. Z27]|uniref:A24 family peptidase n=1 Tax=Altererythrobacter sp. Z27 TaxID=3461147 RepID=UPI004043CEFD
MSLLLVIGAITDIRERRLANWLSLALLLFGLAHGFALGGLSALGWHGAHAAIALLVGMALFAVGVIGGGDAKFYAGAAAYFPISAGLDLLLWVALSGGAAVIAWFGLRRVLRREKPSPESLQAKFPYGVAIAAGAMLVGWQVVGNA